MLRDILKIFILALVIIAAGLIPCRALSPAEYHRVKLQGVDCTMRKVKDPGLMPKLRYQEAALKAEALKQKNERRSYDYKKSVERIAACSVY